MFRIEDPSQSNGDTPQQEGEGEERIKKPDCDHCKVSIEPEMMVIGANLSANNILCYYPHLHACNYF